MLERVIDEELEGFIDERRLYLKDLIIFDFNELFQKTQFYVERFDDAKFENCTDEKCYKHIKHTDNDVSEMKFCKKCRRVMTIYGAKKQFYYLMC